MRLLVCIALAPLAACSTAPQLIAVPAPSPEQGAAQSADYTVNGTATIEAIPDIAEVVIVLSSERKRPRDAAAAVRESQAALSDALVAAGMSASDIQVSRLTLAPVHELVDPRGAKTYLRGYEATLTVTVCTRAFERLPEIMDLAASSGATGLSSRFRVSDLPAIKQQAREQAGRMARQKAESMASVLGVSLGQVRAIREHDGRIGTNDNFFSNSYAPANERTSAAGEGIHGEAVEITVTVEVTYALQ